MPARPRGVRWVDNTWAPAWFDGRVRKISGSLRWHHRTVELDAVPSLEMPLFLGSGLRGSVGLALGLAILHPLACVRAMLAGSSPRAILSFCLWRRTASVFGCTDLRDLHGAPSPLAPLLPRQPARSFATEPVVQIGVAMIVQNEQATIAKAIGSVKPWAAQIVVIDGGSTDRTVALATAAGAQVHLRPFRSDFAAQRNASLALMRTPWTFVLDADETVSEELASLLMLVLPRLRKNEVLSVSRWNVMPERSSDPWLWPDPQVRAFRSDRRYVGRVHERLAGSPRVIQAPVDGPYLWHEKTLLRHYRSELLYETIAPAGHSAEYLDEIKRRVESEGS